MKKLMATSLLLGCVSASAVTIDVRETNCGTTQSVCDALTAELKSYVNEDIPDVSLGDYGTGLANANNFVYKGANSDYSDKFDLFVVKASGGVAVQGDMDDPESADGVGIGAAVTVGVNLDVLPVDKVGPIDLSKMDLFVSFMSYDIDQELDDKMTAEGSLSHLAVSARYQIVDGVDFIPGSMLKWGGVFLHTGFQKSSNSIKVTSEIEDDNIDAGGGASADITNTSATFDIESSTLSIPLEVSTYIRAAYVFTLFGGAGVDIVSGSTDAELDAGGTVNGTGATSGYTATVNANENDSGDADVTNMRVFGGMQFNLPLFRLYAQMNSGIGNDLLGVNIGAKILW